MHKFWVFICLCIINCNIVMSGGSDESESWSSYISKNCNFKSLAVGVGAGTVAVVAAPYALGAIGFTALGVKAGSIAAAVQSVAYGGATSGVFAAAQSAGAAGLSAGASAGIALATGGAASQAVKAHCDTPRGKDGDCK